MIRPPSAPLFSLLLLSSIFYLNFFARIVFSPLLPTLETDLHLSHGQAGAFFFIISCGYFLSLSGSGFVSALTGHKKAILLSMGGICLSLLALSTGSNPVLLKGAFFCLGLAAGIYLPSAVTTISTLFPPLQWGRAFGVHEIAPNLAFLTAPLLTAALLPIMHWTAILQLLAFLVAAATAVYACVGHRVDEKPAPPDLRLCAALAGRVDFWLMILLFSFGISATLGIYSILPTFLVSEHGYSEQSANLLVGISRLPTLATALAGGFLADRIGNRRTIGLVLLGTGAATMLLGLGYGPLWLYIILQPLIAVCFFPAGFALLSHIGPVETRGVIVSFAVPLSFVVGGGVTPFFITRMADNNLFAPAIILAGGIIAAGSLIVRLVKRNPRQEE